MIYVYADGSAGNWNFKGRKYSPGGWAFQARVLDGDASIRVVGQGYEGVCDITSNLAEIQALQHALKWYIRERPEGAITFLSDSQNTLNWCNGTFRCNAPHLKAPIRELQSLWKTADFPRLKWVKGHSGIPGNEAVDFLASKGRRKAQLAIVAAGLTATARQRVRDEVQVYGLPDSFKEERGEVHIIWSGRQPLCCTYAAPKRPGEAEGSRSDEAPSGDAEASPGPQPESEATA